MAWGKANEAWNHTSSIMAMIAAANTDPKSGRTPAPADYHPYLEPPPMPEATPEMLKALFPEREGA